MKRWFWGYFTCLFTHVPACFALYMEKASTSPTITVVWKSTTSSSLQFKPMNNSGIASCSVHHLLLSRQNLLSEICLYPGTIPVSCVITSAPLMVTVSFSSDNHEEPNWTVPCQRSGSLSTFPAHLLWQPSTSDYSLGSQHTKESFHCSTDKETALDFSFISSPKSSSSEVSLASNRTDVKMKEYQFLCQLKNLHFQANSWLSFLSWACSPLEGEE